MLWGSLHDRYTPMLVCKYVDEMAWLPCWPPRGRQVLHHRWIRGQGRHHPKVQNRGISGPSKRTRVLLFLTRNTCVVKRKLLVTVFEDMCRSHVDAGDDLPYRNIQTSHQIEILHTSFHFIWCLSGVCCHINKLCLHLTSTSAFSLWSLPSLQTLSMPQNPFLMFDVNASADVEYEQYHLLP